MAGRRTSGPRAERSSADEAFFPGRATRSGAASGSSTGTAQRTSGTRRQSDIRTRSTVRLLVLRGLELPEATNLTAFLCGIPVADGHWSLREINRLLFLRDLARRGGFGRADGGDRS